jgi:hypothetical protein
VSFERKRRKDFLELDDCMWKVEANMTFEDFERELSGTQNEK